MFKFKKIQLTIRRRILLLMGGSVALSLASYLYVGTQLIVQDKTSYIYDYSYSQVKLASISIQTEIKRFTEFTKRVQGKDLVFIEAQFNAEQKALLASSLVVIQQVDPKTLLIQKVIGAQSSNPLPWPKEEFNRFPVKLEINLEKQEFTLGLRVTQSLVLVGHMKLAQPLLEGTSKDFQFLIAEHAGQVLASKNLPKDTAIKQIPKDVLKPLYDTDFTSGVREVRLMDRDYLMGYDQILSGHYLILSLAPKDLAFSAANTLIKKSIGLGVGILLLAIGSALILIRSLIRRVKELVDATQRVSQGDFSMKIEVSQVFNDELSSLATSFNKMGEEISKLITATAMNARMEQELETAQLVQSRFFPPKNYKSPRIQLTGSSINASECGGDWWHYAEVQDYLIVIMGDATGHGASAALVTASIHSAFSLLVEEMRLVTETLDPVEQILGRMLKTLNAALILTAGELSTFPCLISVIELKTLKMWFYNAGHPLPYLFRVGAEKYEGIASNVSMPMGQKAFSYDSSPTIMDLQPGDRLLWFTDGLFDSRISDGKKIKKKDLLNVIHRQTDGVNKKSNIPKQNMTDFVLNEANQFFGKEATNRPDDITVISIYVPS